MGELLAHFAKLDECMRRRNNLDLPRTWHELVHPTIRMIVH